MSDDENFFGERLGDLLRIGLLGLLGIALFKACSTAFLEVINAAYP